MGWDGMGWDGMVIIGHRSSKSTFDANNEYIKTVRQGDRKTKR